MSEEATIKMADGSNGLALCLDCALLGQKVTFSTLQAARQHKQENPGHLVFLTTVVQD